MSIVNYQLPTAPFIGKEKDNESYLGDFGVRKFDDGIGRFTSIDPMWEMYYSWTPYHYCRNNPVINIDPSGLKDYIYNEKGQLIATEDDWGALEFLNSDNYYVQLSDGTRIEANSERTITQSNWHGLYLTWDTDQSAGFAYQVAQGLSGFDGTCAITYAQKESPDGGKMDTKNSLMPQDNYSERILFKFNGKLYNWQEAGNIVWGACIFQLQIDYFTARTAAELFSLLKKGEFDESNEVDAIDEGFYNGYNFYPNGITPADWDDTTDW